MKRFGLLLLAIMPIVSFAEESASAVVASNPDWVITTRLFKLSHASAIMVADKINAMWNGEFGQKWKISKMAIAFEESNSVMITAPAMILDACAVAISELDVESKQVYIEARFIELGNTASHKLGIDWSMLDGMGGSVKLNGGIESKHATVNPTTGAIDYNRQVHFTGTMDFTTLSLTLRALDSTQDAKIFSNPKIIVSSGKKATVDMTTKYPNVIIAAKRTMNGSDSESIDIDMKMAAIPGEDKMMFAKEAFFSWGISLDVIPRIGTNGLINVQIVPTISSQKDWVTAYPDAKDDDESASSRYTAKYPIIDVQRLITEFNMESGTTAVIGGLSRTEETQVDNGIPLLRKIPWIGPILFGSKVRQKVQKEILVFVTVGIVEPRAMNKDSGLPKNAVLGRQYTVGQKLEPGDRPAKNMEGFDSLDMRSLEEQAQDPLNTKSKKDFSLDDYIPFEPKGDAKKNDDGNVK